MFSESGEGLFGIAINLLILILVMMFAVWLWVKFIESKLGKFIKNHTFDNVGVWFENLSYAKRNIISKLSFFVYVVAVFSVLIYFQM